MNFWHAVTENITRHWGAYTAWAGVLAVAIVSTMPPLPPISFKELWTWGREALQTAIPAARHPVWPPADTTKEK